MVAVDMNAQVGELNTDEAQLGVCLGLDSDLARHGCQPKSVAYVLSFLSSSSDCLEV